MAFDVTPPEIVGFSRDRIVWKFQSDQAGVVSGTLAQNVMVLTGPIAAGTRVPIRWGDTVLSLMAAATPDATGAQFPAGDGSGTYATALASWLSKNYFLDKNFTVEAATHMGQPALFFYARENGEGYDFNTANFPGGSVSTLVPATPSNEPLNPSVFVQVWLGNETGLQFKLVYEGAQGLDAESIAQFDVALILHPHLSAELPDYALPQAERCIYSTRRYYLKYAYAGGENFSAGQMEQTPTHVVTMGGFSELSGGPVSVQGTFKGATAAADRLLMVQDRTRFVRIDEPLYVSWINWRASGKNIHARATITYTDDTTTTTNTATLANVAQYDRLRFGVGFGQLNMAALPKQVKEYTVQLRDDTGPVSEPLRCVLDVSFRSYVRYFAHISSYGGLEIVKTFGKGSGEWKLFRETAEQVLPYDLKSTDGQYVDWNLKYQETFEVATGFLPKRHQSYFLDFFLSPIKHRVINGTGYAVNVVSESVQHGTDGQNLFGFAFKFQYSRQLDAVSEQDLDVATSPAQQIPPGVQPAGSILIPTPGSDWQGIIDPYPIQGSSNPVASGGVWSRLAQKQDIIATGDTLQYLRGDGSLANFTTAVRAVELDPTVPTYAKALVSKEKVLSDLRTIDGLDSGLDADLWRGQAPAQMTVWKSLQWAAAITLSLSGAVTGSASIDGSGNVTLATTLTAPGLSGTANRLAKFSPVGNNVVDSAITELAGLVSVNGSLQVYGPDGYGRLFGRNAVTGNPITAMVIPAGYQGTSVLEIGGGTIQGEAVNAIRFRLGPGGVLGAGNVMGTWTSTGLGINVNNPTTPLHVGGDIRANALRLDAPQGFASMVVQSSTLIANLHADLLDGWHGSYYLDATNFNAGVFPIQRHPLSGVAAGSYSLVAVNSYGHVTSGSNPTTLAGYGITDAVSALGSYVNPAWLVSIPWAKITGAPTLPAISGTVNYVARFTGASALGIGLIQDDGIGVGIGKAPTVGYGLDLLGSLRVGHTPPVSTGEYGADMRLATLLLGNGASGFAKNQILLDSFYDFYRLEIGSGKQSHTANHAGIFTTDGNGPGSLFEGRYGVLTLIGQKIADSRGNVEIRTGTDSTKISRFTHSGDILAHRFLGSSVTSASVAQPGLRLLGADAFGSVLPSYLAADLALVNAPATISGAWMFNTVAPTSTVPNTTANNFELATVGWVKAYTTEGTGGGSATDPTPSWVNAITAANITSWNTASSWGNHNAAGYQTVAGMGAYQPSHPLLTNISGLGNGFWCRVAGSNAVYGRTIEGSISINVDNGSGFGGNPVISITPVHAGFTVNNITVRNTGQVLGITPNTYANSIQPLLPASVLHDSRPPQFSAIPALSATAGQPYSFTLNLAPYKTSYHNAANMQIKAILTKPAWLVTALSGLQAAITGTPPTSGAFQLVFTVVDDNGNETTVPIDGTVLEPGTEQPVTITAKLFNMADGTSVNIVSGQSYPYRPQWQLRFYVVGTHNQVAQVLTGVGADATWGPENAKPGGVTTEDSNHGVFIGSAQGTDKGPGTYTFTPKAYLAGVVKAQPQFIFTLVEDTGGENFTGAYAEFYTGGGTLLEDQIADSTFTAAAPWKAKWRIMNKDFDKLVMGVSYSATQEGTYAPLYERTVTGITPSLALQRFDVFATGLSSVMPSDGSGYYLLSLQYFKSGAQFDSTVANFRYNKTGGGANTGQEEYEFFMNMTGEGWDPSTASGFTPVMESRVQAFNYDWGWGITGIRGTVDWGQWETSEGVFDRATLQKQIAWCRARGLKLSYYYAGWRSENDPMIPVAHRAVGQFGTHLYKGVPGYAVVMASMASDLVQNKFYASATQLAAEMATYENAYYLGPGLAGAEELVNPLMFEGQPTQEIMGFEPIMQDDFARWLGLKGKSYSRPSVTQASYGCYLNMDDIGKEFARYITLRITNYFDKFSAAVWNGGGGKIRPCYEYADAGDATGWHLASNWKMQARGLFGRNGVLYGTEGTDKYNNEKKRLVNAINLGIAQEVGQNIVSAAEFDPIDLGQPGPPYEYGTGFDYPRVLTEFRKCYGQGTQMLSLAMGASPAEIAQLRDILQTLHNEYIGKPYIRPTAPLTVVNVADMYYNGGDRPGNVWTGNTGTQNHITLDDNSFYGSLRTLGLGEEPPDPDPGGGGGTPNPTGLRTTNIQISEVNGNLVDTAPGDSVDGSGRRYRMIGGTKFIVAYHVSQIGRVYNTGLGKWVSTKILCDANGHAIDLKIKKIPAYVGRTLTFRKVYYNESLGYDTRTVPWSTVGSQPANYGLVYTSAQHILKIT